jgi:hypothetical protein
MNSQRVITTKYLSISRLTRPINNTLRFSRRLCPSVLVVGMIDRASERGAEWDLLHPVDRVSVEGLAQRPAARVTPPADVFPKLSPPARYLPTSLLPSRPKFIRLRMPEGLNTMTRRGEVGTSLPVFRLRPMRWPFLRTISEPNDAV